MKLCAGSSGKLVALRRINVPLACAIVALAAPALAAAEEPRVLEDEPYYLGLHDADGENTGTILMLHGGGWQGDLGSAADAVMGEWIERLRGWGYDVANLGYRSGADSLEDSLAAFDLLRERVGPDEPLCIFGGSAGGQLALIVAARRGADVECVIDVAGPPDLEHWGSQPAAGAGQRLAIEAFGEDRLAELSPINNVDRIEAPVLVAAAPCDVYIELSAQESFVRALDRAGGQARLQVVESGDDVSFAHCSVDDESFDRFLDAAEDFLDNPSRAVAETGDGDSGFDLPIALIIAIPVVGVAILFWALRRRA